MRVLRILVTLRLLLSLQPCLSARGAVQAVTDDEPPAGDEGDSAKRLDWRLDPHLSYSDYTLEIISSVQSDGSISKKKKRRTQYHVHKNILSVGLKKSDYFAKLFQQKSPEPTPIELPKLAADAVPIMLDYVYGETTDPLRITTETASALFYLGEVFQIRQLAREAKQFWQKNLLENSVNYLTYYEHATILGIDPILQAVARVCAFQLLQQQTPEKIVQMTSPEFWLQILQVTLTESDGIFMSDAVSLHASTLTARVCSRSRTMDETLFLQLTDSKYLPRLTPQAARTFLDLEEMTIKAKVTKKLTSLQNRCLDALTDGWQAGTWTNEAFLKSKSPLLLRELLFRSLAKARSTLVEQEKLTSDAVTMARRQQITMEKELRIAKDVQSDLERQLSESKRMQRKLEAQAGISVHRREDL